MSPSEPPEDSRKKLVDSLIAIGAKRYELWKYFEDRADQLGERLWSTGLWLMGIVAATLSLPFAARFVVVPGTESPAEITAPFPVALIAVFGIAFLLYSYFALRDLRDHIEGNWIRATYARTLKLDRASWGGRKRHGWNVLIAVGALALVAFAGLLFLALVPAL